MSGRTSLPEQAVRSFSIWKELRSNTKPSTGWYVRTADVNPNVNPCSKTYIVRDNVIYSENYRLQFSDKGVG